MNKVNKSLRAVAYDMKILVVEDDTLLQNSLNELLSKFFKEIEVVCNAEEALKLHAQKDYDVIITDLNIPGMGGIELIETIRLINTTQHIVVISEPAEPKELIELINIGIDLFLLKPVDSSDMMFGLTKICQVIDNQKMLEYLSKMIEETNDELQISLDKCQQMKTSNIKNEVPTMENRNLNIEAKTILENSSYKMSAKEFQDAYPFELDKTNENLEDLEDKFNILLGNNLKNCKKNLPELQAILSDFAKEIEIIPQFSKLAYGIQQVQRTFESIESSQLSTVMPMIVSLFDSLGAWRKSVFYYQDADDIHYMDNSIISDALSLENFMSNQKTVSDSDMEIF